MLKFNVVIEMPLGTQGVKYEINSADGHLYVDRLMPTAFAMPTNYGFIPNTKGQDKDPIDVLVICDVPLQIKSIMSCRAVGALSMADEGGIDDKIIAVPDESVSKAFDHIREIDQIDTWLLMRIKHFFQHYKDLEEGKFTNIGKFLSRAVAEEIIKQTSIN